MPLLGQIRDIMDLSQRTSNVVGANSSLKHTLAPGTADGANDMLNSTADAFISDAKLERRLRWKIDICIIPTVALLYLFCFIDRANIGNAKIAGMDRDIGMKHEDYNKIISAFYVSYILCEIPSNILCKWLGPGWVLPLMAVLFGLTSVCMAFVDTVPQAAGVRFVLGIFEAGLMPGTAYYLSRWYRRSELALRLSLYIVMAPLAGAFGGLLATALLKLENLGKLQGWRMIFAIEGIITVGLGLVAFFTLTDRPETAIWLSPGEKKLAIARVRCERVGVVHVVDGIELSKLKRGILNPVVLGTSFIFLLNNIIVQGLSFFAPTIVASIYQDKSITQKQLFTVPPYVVGAFFTVIFSLISRRTDRRHIFILLSAPLIMVGYSLFLGSKSHTVRYVATFFIASSAFAVGSLSNAQVSANVVGDTARSAGIATNVMLGNIGGLISAWTYLPSDSPDFPIGNGVNLAAAGTILIASIIMLVWMKMDNARRLATDSSRELEGKTQREIEDMDWTHPHFLWQL